MSSRARHRQRARHAGPWAIATLVLVAVAVSLAAVVPVQRRSLPRGVVVDGPGASPGYTLFSPLSLRQTLLIANDGRVVHRWRTTTPPGLNQYLLADGDLLRAGDVGRTGPFAAGHGAGGRIEQLSWDGDVRWRLDVADDRVRQHHDIEPMPNGNVLLVAWERVSRADALAAGRDPSLLPDGELWPDTVMEYSPSLDRVVWQWRVWDHLVQDRDPTKPGYGVVAEHPGRIDVNFVLDGNGGDADWNHVNAVTYDPARDEVMISSRSFSEVWIVDHGTTTDEAAGPAGDLRFRYGNPRAYDRGTRANQQLFVQHDPVWIDEGPDGHDILVFSNGLPEVRPYSTVEQISPRIHDGSYVLDDHGRFAATIRRIHPRDPDDRVFAAIISGAQRLPNGDTLVVYGNYGTMIEVTPAGRTVWRYENPYFPADDGPSTSGAGATIEPWWTFRALRYPVDYPGVARVTDPGT